LGQDTDGKGGGITPGVPRVEKPAKLTDGKVQVKPVD